MWRAEELINTLYRSGTSTTTKNFYFTVPVAIKSVPDHGKVLQGLQDLEATYRSKSTNSPITLAWRANSPHFTILGPIQVTSNSVFFDNMPELSKNFCSLLRSNNWTMKLTLSKYGFIDANHFWYGGIFQHDQNYMIFYDLFKTSIAQTWTQLTNSPIYNNMKTGDIQIEDNGEKLDVDYINKFEIVPLLSLPKYAHPSSFKPHISMYQIHWNFRLLGNKMLRGRLTTAQVEQDMRSAHGPDVCDHEYTLTTQQLDMSENFQTIARCTA